MTLTLLVACGRAPSSSAPTVRDSAGVAIVEHGAMELSSLPRYELSPEPLLRIDRTHAQFTTLGAYPQAVQYQEGGSDDGAFSPAIFGGIVRFAATADGDWVGDPDDTEVRQVREHMDVGKRRWARFSPDGTVLQGRLEHSAALRVLRIDGDRMLAVERDALDVEQLVVYALCSAL